MLALIYHDFIEMLAQIDHDFIDMLARIYQDFKLEHQRNGLWLKHS
jgi:hypothetical protein